MAMMLEGQGKNKWLAADWVACVLVVIFAALPFLQVSDFSFLNYDDPLHVSAQPAVLSGLNVQSVGWSMTATPSNLWHPLTWMSYMAEVSLFGGGAEAPGVHHLGNLLLHLGTTLVFFLLLRSFRVCTVVVALAALLFSLHPLHVEPVAWISSRKDVLSGFFAMLSLLLYQKSKKQAVLRWWCGFVMLAALASKPSMVVLPALFVLLDWMSLDDDQVNRSLMREVVDQLKGKWGYGLLAACVAAVAIVIQYAGSHSGFIAGQSLFSRLSYLPASVGFYIQHSVWPRALTFEYVYPSGIRFWLLTGGGLMFFVALCLGRWIGRAWVIGGLWFLICLAPVLGFFYVGSGFTADRYTYLALAGPVLALAVWLQALPRREQLISQLVLGFVVVVFGLFSFQQAGVWRDDFSLFSHGVRVEPESGTAQTNLATLYRSQGKDDLALEHYQKALKLHSSQYIVCYNMARIYGKRGEVAKAMQWCRNSLASYPNYARAHHYLAQLMEESASGADEAMAHFQEACQLEPGNARFALSCARAYAKRGEYAEAEYVLRAALSHGSHQARELERLEEMLRTLKPYLNR